MTIEIDSITFKRANGTITKTYGFNTDGNSEGWVNDAGANRFRRHHQMEFELDYELVKKGLEEGEYTAQPGDP